MARLLSKYGLTIPTILATARQSAGSLLQAAVRPFTMTPNNELRVSVKTFFAAAGSSRSTDVLCQSQSPREFADQILTLRDADTVPNNSISAWMALI